MTKPGEEMCHQCGKVISRRAIAHVWNGASVICTPCLKSLQGEERRGQAAIGMAGRAGASWLVHDGRKQYGPYTTDQLIALLRQARVDWMWKIWREGMWKWLTAANLFTIPVLSNGRIELRDFGQGDGTYHPAG